MATITEARETYTASPQRPVQACPGQTGGSASTRPGW